MQLTTTDWRALIADVAAAFEQEKGRLSALDGEIGDGDHGITMAAGWAAAARAAEAAPGNADCGEITNAAAMAFLNAVGASSGPLYATALMRGASVLRGVTSVDAQQLSGFFSGALDGIRQRGKAERGDKTMLDAWEPAVAAMRESAAGGADMPDILAAAMAGAEEGARATRDMVARKGRAARLGERSLGHEDPGAASTVVLFAAVERGVRKLGAVGGE